MDRLKVGRIKKFLESIPDDADVFSNPYNSHLGKYDNIFGGYFIELSYNSNENKVYFVRGFE